MTARILLLAALAVAGGCKKAAPTPTPAAGGSGRAAPAAPPQDEPADDPPGMQRWTDAQLEEAVRESLRLAKVSLKKESRDRYTGTGTDAEGRPAKLTVRYRPGEYKVDCEVTDPAYPGGVRKASYHWHAEGVTPKWRANG